MNLKDLKDGIELLGVISANVPQTVKTVGQLADWVAAEWRSFLAAYKKPASEITITELKEHFAQAKRSSDLIQDQS